MCKALICTRTHEHSFRTHLYLLIFSGGWNPELSDGQALTAWIQADLRIVHLLLSVTTQGRSDAAMWVTSYRISYGNDVSSLTEINVNYGGNTDQNTSVTNQLPCNTLGRYIRLRPTGRNTYTVALRWDVIGVPDTESENAHARKFV